MEAVLNQTHYLKIHDKIIKLLENARLVTVQKINSIMTATYWEIGHNIVEFEQKGKERATYGDELIKQLSKDLTNQFGRGFSRRNLAQMRQFYLNWPILQTPSAKFRKTLKNQDPIKYLTKVDLNIITNYFKLPWSAYVRLLSLKNSEARNFYEKEALRCGWSIRQLERQINSQFYERTMLSKKKVEMLKKSEKSEPNDVITPMEAIKDPFVLEFLNLKDQYSETDLEEALIQNLADFLLELGDDFSYIGRQRRLRLDDSWYKVDLLFFHRTLKCLIIIDLKIGKFGHADAGQMHLYLNYANEHWVKAGENPPIGLILCAQKGEMVAHYALDNLPNKILAAEYRTILPNERILAKELEKARQKLEIKKIAKESFLEEITDK